MNATQPDDNIVAKTKDGYIVRAYKPGFRVFKGKRMIASTAFWTEAVAVVRVEREANRAIRRN